MKIKKKFQGIIDQMGRILNTKSNSQVDTYSCDFIENRIDSLVYRIFPTTVQFNPTSANSSGYKTFTVTIPEGCIAIVLPRIDNIGNSVGLQLTVANTYLSNYLGGSETQTVYVNYFAPQAISYNCLVTINCIIFRLK